MQTCQVPNPNAPHDLTRGAPALLIWCLPVAMLYAGGVWQAGGVWLWAAAFAIMGTGCLLNARRCGRTHCYLTGPVLLLAALWSLLSVFGVVGMHRNLLMLAVVTVAALAYLAEYPLGRYAGARGRARDG